MRRRLRSRQPLCGELADRKLPRLLEEGDLVEEGDGRDEDGLVEPGIGLDGDGSNRLSEREHVGEGASARSRDLDVRLEEEFSSRGELLEEPGAVEDGDDGVESEVEKEKDGALLLSLWNLVSFTYLRN